MDNVLINYRLKSLFGFMLCHMEAWPRCQLSGSVVQKQLTALTAFSHRWHYWERNIGEMATSPPHQPNTDITSTTYIKYTIFSFPTAVKFGLNFFQSLTLLSPSCPLPCCSLSAHQNNEGKGNRSSRAGAGTASSVPTWIFSPAYGAARDLHLLKGTN